MLDLINRDEIESLVHSQGGPHLSIFVPARSTPNQSEQDTIRLGNCIRHAREKLSEYWMPHAEAEAFIEPVIEFCDGLERRHGPIELAPINDGLEQQAHATAVERAVATR